MSKTQLLCTFTKHHHLITTVNSIVANFEVVFGKIFVLGTDSKSELICSYNVTLTRPVKFLDGTISVHRKKESNTIYTINALNELIIEMNNGVLDKTFPIEWSNYQNMLLVTTEEGLKRIPTHVTEVVYVEDILNSFHKIQSRRN